MEVARSGVWSLWAPVFIYSTNILVRLLTVNMENCLTPKNQKMASDLQAFLVFSQHPTGITPVITPVNP